MVNVFKINKGDLRVICIEKNKHIKGRIVTILENYFWQQSRRCKSEVSMQLGCMRSCEPHGRVQMHNPGRVHWQSNGNLNILSVLSSYNGNF